MFQTLPGLFRSCLLVLVCLTDSLGEARHVEFVLRDVIVGEQWSKRLWRGSGRTPRRASQASGQVGKGGGKGASSLASTSAEALPVSYTARKARQCLLCSCKSTDESPLTYGLESMEHMELAACRGEATRRSGSMMARSAGCPLERCASSASTCTGRWASCLHCSGSLLDTCSLAQI